MKSNYSIGNTIKIQTATDKIFLDYRAIRIDGFDPNFTSALDAGCIIINIVTNSANNGNKWPDLSDASDIRIRACRKTLQVGARLFPG